MAKSKKILLSKIIKNTEIEKKKEKDASIKTAYEELLKYLENVHSATIVSDQYTKAVIYIYSSISRSAKRLSFILKIITGDDSSTPRLRIGNNVYGENQWLHYDIIIYSPTSDVAATAVQINMPEGHLLTPEVLDDQYNMLLNELRNRAK